VSAQARQSAKTLQWHLPTIAAHVANLAVSGAKDDALGATADVEALRELYDGRRDRECQGASAS